MKKGLLFVLALCVTFFAMTCALGESTAVGALAAEVETLRAEKTQLQADLGKLQADNAALAIEYETLVATYAALEQKYTDLLVTCTNQEASHTALQANNAALVMEHEKLVAKYDAVELERNDLMVSYANLEAGYTELTANYVELQAAYTALEAENAQLLTDKTALETALAVLQESKTAPATESESTDASEDTDFTHTRKLNITRNQAPAQPEEEPEAEPEPTGYPLQHIDENGNIRTTADVLDIAGYAFTEAEEGDDSLNFTDVENEDNILYYFSLPWSMEEGIAWEWDYYNSLEAQTTVSEIRPLSVGDLQGSCFDVEAIDGNVLMRSTVVYVPVDENTTISINVEMYRWTYETVDWALVHQVAEDAMAALRLR